MRCGQVALQGLNRFITNHTKFHEKGRVHATPFPIRVSSVAKNIRADVWPICGHHSILTENRVTLQPRT
jgi:hypothetical protein